MPVPSSSLPFDFTSMETTEWMTLLTSSGMVTLPLRTAAPGAASLSWMVTLEPLPLSLLSARAVTPAPMPPPMRAATMTTGSHARTRPGPARARAAGRGEAPRGRRVGERDRGRRHRGGRAGVVARRRRPRARRWRGVGRRRVGRREGRRRRDVRALAGPGRDRGGLGILARSPGGRRGSHPRRWLDARLGGCIGCAGSGLGLGPGCSVSSLMWILLKGTWLDHTAPRWVWPVPAVPAVPADVPRHVTG